MKIEIYDQKAQPEEKVYLRLMYTANGVTLRVVDLDGNSAIAGFLMDISDDGTVKLHSDINPDFGFKLDARGRLAVFREGEG